MNINFTKAFAIGALSLGAISCGGSGGSSVTVTGSLSNLSTSSSVVYNPDARAVTDGIDPTSVKLKIYQVAVSTNTDCSSPTTIFETTEASAEYVTFTSSSTPTLGSGSIADGSYPCVIIEMSDQVKFTPSEPTDAFCVADTEYTMDVCQDRGESTDDTSVLLDGTTITCTNGDNRVALYLSTLSTALPQEPGSEGSEGNPFVAPTATSTGDGFLLDGAFVVSGASSGNFVVDFTGRVAESDGECGMESPNWGFQ